ncbi:MAG: hypothetical protein QM723_25620 [Myxococcaceae bacterium]
MRTSTAELFQAVQAPADAVSLQRMLDSRKGEALTLTMALDMGAAIAERVGAIHASGRLLGAFDAARVVCTRDGRVLLSKDAALPLAPELRRGDAPSTAADVYAVGFLIYQLLTGKTPAQANAEEEVSRLREVPPPSQFNPKVDGELDAVVLAALRVEPSERPASVLALQAALDGISEELELAPEPEAIAAMVVKLLAEPKVAPVPEPRPSPGAAVATSKLQTAFSREAPLFPGRAPEPVKAEALTTSPFHPWLPPSPPAPPPEMVPAGRTTQTDPLLSVAAVVANTPMSREELAKTTPVITARFEPAVAEVPLKTTMPMRAPRPRAVTPPPLPSTSQAIALAEAVQLVETPAPSVVVRPSVEVPAAPHAHEESARKWLQSPGEESFIDADYEQSSTPEPLMTPGLIAGASVAGVVMLIALVIALLAPSGAAPQVQQVQEQPVRTRAVRPVVEAAKPAAVPVVTKAVAAPAVKKKAPVKHAAPSRRMSP